MFCSNCGKKISDNSVYCNKCGMEVNNDDITLGEDRDSPTLAVTKQFNCKQSNIKKAIIGLILLIIICGAGLGGYKYVQAKDFNSLIKDANQKLNEGNYDEAIQLYNKALAYKNDNDVQKKLALVQNYKQYQNTYNEGLKLMNDKKYSEAIEKLNTINQAAVQLYNSAQNKIEECKKNIINDDIQAANDSIKNGEYDAASKFVDDILKIDSNNNEAKQLKAKIEQAQDKPKIQVQKQEVNQNNNDGMTKEQALEIVANYSGNREWNVVENTASQQTIIEGSDNIIGHKCYFFVPKGGRAIPFVIDKTTGKLYEETDRLSGQNRVYKLVK